jgi:hypothetical protein
MLRILPLIVGGAVLLVSGLVNGLMTSRWSVSEELHTASARLEALPMKLGDWEGQSYQMDERQLTVAEAAGHLSRRYTHRRTGAEISLLVLAGRGGPMVVHRPEVCYVASGFVQVGTAEKWQGPAESPLSGSSFWAARFSRPGADPQPLRILYAWGTEGDWEAADNPRLKYSRLPALYKIYLVRRLARPDESLDKDPSLDFLQVVVPELRKCLDSSPSDWPANQLVAQAKRGYSPFFPPQLPAAHR